MFEFGASYKAVRCYGMNRHLRGSTIRGTTQLTDTERLSVPITMHETMTSDLPVVRQDALS
jgi:hypothetical protein